MLTNYMNKTNGTSKRNKLNSTITMKAQMLTLQLLIQSAGKQCHKYGDSKNFTKKTIRNHLQNLI